MPERVPKRVPERVPEGVPERRYSFDEENINFASGQENSSLL